MRALALLALAACGDNELPNAAPLAPAHDLAIVAHEDDDLLFMQPDLIEAVREHTGVTIVYVTAGNDDRDLDYATKRYTGVMAAYSTLAAGTWRCGWTELAGHAAEHCRLDEENLSLVFLGYPDGGKQGEFASSLLALWEGRITGADTIADRSAHYDREGLIATVGEVIATSRPATIHTLEVAATHGSDHSDHMLVGALAVLARARANSDAELLAYRGYDISGEPVNDFAPISELATAAFEHYSACAEGCAACGEACATFSATYAGYLQRRYAVGFGRHAIGQLAIGGACMSVAGDAIVMASCATAPVWRIDSALHLGDRCAAVETGELTSCDAATPVALDEEGHIWLGIAPATATDLAHLDCIDGDAHAALCGGDDTPAWSVLAPTVTTALARPARLADVTGDGIADSCAIAGAGVWCATGDGSGGFAPAVKLADLAIDPDTLAIGELGGVITACGRDATGILCTTGRVDLPLTDLAIVGGELCGLGPGGPTCGSDVVSTEAAVEFADLDGDGVPDWCTSTAACGRGADRGLSTAAVPWAFSLDGIVEPGGVVGDVDGDGRADLCSIEGTRVSCAFGHGNGFGPRTPVMELAVAPLSVWLAPHAICADTGDIICSSP
jgi:LmbE family N-acetylglucosaminyl deacetylase